MGKRKKSEDEVSVCIMYPVTFFPLKASNSNKELSYFYNKITLELSFWQANIAKSSLCRGNLKKPTFFAVM